MNNYHQQANSQMAKPQQSEASAPAMNDYELQIRTAKQYPRNIGGAINQAKQLVTMTAEVAQDCTYSLPRGGETITGPSVRFAEILLSVWGNARAITRVTHMDSEYIYASADFVDLELNNAIRIERRRRIVNSQGSLFKADMIQTTGNAASSIALRQAILQGIPAGYWQTVYDHVQQELMGDIKTLSENRQKILQALSKYGVSAEIVCAHLKIESTEQINQQHLSLLFGIGNALKAGDVTAETLAQEAGYTVPTGKGAGVNKPAENVNQKPETVTQKPATCKPEPAQTATNTAQQSTQQSQPEGVPDGATEIEI